MSHDMTTRYHHGSLPHILAQTTLPPAQINKTTVTRLGSMSYQMYDYGLDYESKDWIEQGLDIDDIYQL